MNNAIEKPSLGKGEMIDGIIKKFKELDNSSGKDEEWLREKIDSLIEDFSDKVKGLNYEEVESDIKYLYSRVQQGLFPNTIKGEKNSKILTSFIIESINNTNTLQELREFEADKVAKILEKAKTF